MKKDKRTINHIKEKKLLLFPVMLAFLMFTGCTDQLTDSDITAVETSTFQTDDISLIDGNPILKMDSNTFYQGDYFEQFRNGLASSYGKEILDELNVSAQKAKSMEGGFTDAGPVLLNSVFKASKNKSAESFSTHFILEDPDGFKEEFVLGTRRYIPPSADGNRAKAANKSNKTLDPENTYLALNVDRFYLEDDEQGNELWPVTFTAVSMADPDNEIEVTFDQNGMVSSTYSESKHKSDTQTSEDFDLVFVEPISATNSELEPIRDDGGGGGGGGGSTSRINDWSRGEDTGSYGAYDTYFGIKNIRLAWTGDGDGAAELQMFVKNNDNYNYNFPVRYKYRFDRVVRHDPVHGGYPEHSIIEGADKGWPYEIYYEVPDVNQDGYDYNFNILGFVSHQGSNYSEFWSDHFPLFNLSQRPGPWRIVLSDDDKDYADFSRRQQSDFAIDVQTYHMNDGIWRDVYTGFTVEEKNTGSSDDPILESGVRRVTEGNAEDRGGFSGNINAYKYYDGGNR
ncbi:MAG: hypothetical protein WED10_14235, partial [Brumimicrobium sp.]